MRAQTIGFIIVAFLPGLAYLLLILRYDRVNREPRKYVLGVFALGMFAVVPAILLELLGGELLDALFPRFSAHPYAMMVTAFILIGPVEELCKYLAVRSVYEGPHFKDPLDGVVYASAAAMGFASLENAFYVSNTGWDVFWLRAVLAIPGHLMFSAWWGYQLGQTKFGLGGSLGRGVAFAAFAHGLYDALLMSPIDGLQYLVGPMLIGSMVLFRRQLRELWLLARSFEAGATPLGRVLVCACENRYATSEARCPRCNSGNARLSCGRCGHTTSWRQHACAKCHTVFDDPALICIRCRDPFPPHLSQCPFCGQAAQAAASP